MVYYRDHYFKFFVFCSMDKENLVVLVNGFQKRTHKAPKNEIALAEKFKQPYFDEKDE